jgi:hypothetical protein
MARKRGVVRLAPAVIAAATLAACASSAGAPSHPPATGIAPSMTQADQTAAAIATRVEKILGPGFSLGTSVPGASPRPPVVFPLPASPLRLIVDADASAAGIQPARVVDAGDTFQVAVVLAAAPSFDGTRGGVASFNLELDYDRTKIVAPTIAGGPTTQRNPRPNVAALGGDAAGWGCEPAPEGDLYDPGGTEGDGDPATGQAFLSCFMTGPSPASGDIVLATVTFVAVAPGDGALTLSHVAVADSAGVEFAHCPGDPAGPAVPCEAAALTVR